MTFDELLSRVRDLLQHQGRLSYRALKRRFNLNDDDLEDLKAELIRAQRLAIDEDGEVLVWTGRPERLPALGTVPSCAPLTYTPRYLAEKILTAKHALEGERKQVTVLFADLKDSMELLADRDPEEARALLDPVLERMMDAVHRYEGTVNQVLGDGIMALFGAPLAHEDHAVRACYAALAMQEAIRRYAEEVRCKHGLLVQIRVGLHSGEVVVRAISNDLHVDYSAIGQTTHLAARMEQCATPGSSLLTAATLRLAEDFVQVTALGPAAIKGLTSPVEVFELVGARPTWGRLQGFAARGLTRFAGRQAERATLDQALERAGAGAGQVLAVVGEPGVGKTRLCYELARSALPQGWLVLACGAVSYGRASPYLPVIDLLKAYFQMEARDDARKVRDKVIGKLLGLDVAFGPMLPAFLTLLDVPVEDPRWQALNPQQRHQRTLEALRHLVLRESQIQPLLVLVENLHWIDSETQTVLESLIEQLSTARILLLVNYRPEYRHAWGGKRFYTEVQLDPLPPANADELLQALLGHDAGLQPLKALLIAQTQGNPFFVEESVRTLVQTQALMGQPGAYRLAKPVPRIQMPATVQALLAARIDRLSFEEKRLLQAAAVIGRDVPFALLQSITAQPEEQLRRGLARLQAAGFLYESCLFPERVYTFRHALTREAAYGSLLERHRQAYHAAVGFALEEGYADRLDEVFERLAHHFGRSPEDARAVDYAILAAGKAQRRWANAEALAHFEAARRRLEAMPDTEANRLRRIDAVLQQGEVQFALGRHMEHLAALESIRAWVDRTADRRRRATWAYWMGFLHSLTGSGPEIAIGYCRDAAAMAEAGGFEEIQAVAESCLAQVYTVAGDLRGAVAAGERALATFEARGNLWWACRTLWHLIVASNAIGAWGQSLEYGRRALEHGRALDDLRLKVVAWCRTGSTHIQRGDPRTGLRCCEEALALAPIPFDAAMIKAVRGHGLVKAGEVEAGTAALAEAAAWFDGAQLRYTGAAIRLWLGEAYLHQGDRRQARPIFEEVLATSREAGYRHLEGVAHRFLGESLALEDPTTASAHLASAIGILQNMGARNEMAKGLVAQANLRRAAGDAATARTLFERALARFECLGTLDEPSRVRTTLRELQNAPSA
jgi:class 3 adenylate cyclase/tetratricopeptide (TPR) repeat protein